MTPRYACAAALTIARIAVSSSFRQGRMWLMARACQLHRFDHATVSIEDDAHLGLPGMGGAKAGPHAEVLRAFGLGDEDLAAWREAGLSDEEFEGWLTDRVARRPAGCRAREVYGADDIHDFARRAILDALALAEEDRVLDIGCGGGLLLRDALAAGARVTGLDHAEEMVSLARERAPGAEIVLGSAEQLPFTDGSFTAIAMSIVLFFLPDPISVLGECRRVLAPGGRVALY